MAISRTQTFHKVVW